MRSPLASTGAAALALLHRPAAVVATSLPVTEMPSGAPSHTFDSPMPPPCADALMDCLSAKDVPVKFPGDSDWNNYATTYNARLQYTPVAIVLPDHEHHISDAVVCAASLGIHVQAKSGGHSYASFSTGGRDGSMIIDLQNLQEVAVSLDGIAKVGAGVRLGNLDRAIYNQSRRALAHGTYRGVGVGGHFTHGGYGHSSRAWGLALDQIVALDVVLADGSYVHSTETAYPDVYFAMRGAAESFGIVVNFYLQTHPAPESVVNWAFDFGGLLKHVPNAVKTFQHIQQVAQDPKVMSRYLSFGMTFNGSLGFRIAGVYMGSVDHFNNSVAPSLLQGLPIAPSSTFIREFDWLTSLTFLSGSDDLATPLHNYHDRDNFFAKSVTTSDPMSAETLNTYFSYIKNNGSTAPTGWFTIINLYGGIDSQINAKDANFSSYPCRNVFWVTQHYATAPLNITFPEAGVDFITGMNEAMTRHMTSFGAYLNYVDPSLTAEEAHKLYYGPHLYQRLLKLKDKIDPSNVFANPQSIGSGLANVQ